MKIYKKTICPLDCPDSCGLLAGVENNRVVDLKGDPDHPYTRGVICRKMKRYPARVHSPDRVLYPQIRVGKKGAGSFERISWDQAWDCLTKKLSETIDEHGGEAVLPYCYAGNMGQISRFSGFPLFHKIGTSRLEQTICSATARGGWKKICGDVGGSPPERAAEADLIVAWGINIKVSNLHFWPYVTEARKRGAKFVVIDPYRNDTARSADEHVKLKPGGDSALALGILKLLIEKDQVDDRFIEDDSVGFDELAAYVRRTPIQEFEQQSGIAQNDIARLAELIGRHPKTFIRIGVGLSRNSRGGMAVRAIGSLAAACGLFNGEPGRGVLLFSGAFSGDSNRLTMPELAEHPTRTINMIHLGEALNNLAPPIKMLMVYNSNPLSVAPDGSMVRQGLCRDDLFTVVHEQVMTPTARYADLLLPATTFLENRDLYTGYGHFFLGVADRVIEPLGEAISNFDLFQILAQKMGLSDEAFHQSLDQRLQGYFETINEIPDDYDLGSYQDGTYIESKKAGETGSAFASNGKRFRFVSEDDGALPRYPQLVSSCEFDNPDLMSRFPFRLITPPNDKLLNSTFGEFYPQDCGSVLIHPEDSEIKQIRDGAEVTIYNLRGRVTRKAAVTADTQPGVLVAEGIFWPVADDEGGINDLTSQQCSDIGGGAIFHESLVDIVASSSDS